ncbi:MAG: hypothetical protein WCQ53_03675 [bacterium]
MRCNLDKMKTGETVLSETVSKKTKTAYRTIVTMELLLEEALTETEFKKVAEKLFGDKLIKVNVSKQAKTVPSLQNKCHMWHNY